jgi:hypothetical protein
MSLLELRDDLQRRLESFAWDQWSQMGISAAPRRWDPWAADPEALLMLTFEVGRGEPRLFDEVLDWLVVNQKSVSVQRLRNLIEDEEDRALVEAVLGWLGERRRRPRFEAKAEHSGPAEPFFRGLMADVAEPDPAFLAQGFIRPSPEPSRGSQPPALLRPINFAFRLRALLGIGARAEVSRVLLTLGSPSVNTQVLARSTGFTKRNVQEAVNSLRAADVIGAYELGNEQRFTAPLDRWRVYLELESLPAHVDWPQLFTAYRRVLRWLSDPSLDGLSDYMLASQGRTLVEELGPDLRFAGVRVNEAAPLDDSYMESFVKDLMAQMPG